MYQSLIVSLNDSLAFFPHYSSEHSSAFATLYEREEKVSKPSTSPMFVPDIRQSRRKKSLSDPDSSVFYLRHMLNFK